MSIWRRVLLVPVAVAFGAALAIACSTAYGTGNDAPPAEAGPSDSSGDDADARSAADAGDADAGDAASVRFCAQQVATAIFCDDFEENDGGLLSAWKPVADGGAVVAAQAPLRAGHAAKVTASGAGADVELTFTFQAASAIAGVVLDVDMLIDTADYDYIDLVDLQVAGPLDAYFGGVSKAGSRLGMQFTPQEGPSIAIDGAWHHIRVELHHDATGFSQRVTIDATVLEQTTTDLSAMNFAGIHLGVSSPLPPGALAVIYFDNVLLRSP